MTQSATLFRQALHYIPGGVNSPVRAFRGVGGTPLFIERATGPYLYDVDGQRYIDYVGSWGPMILGHNNPVIAEAVQEAVANGLSFGAPSENEVRLAQLITELMPSLEMVRLVNSGTEATMSAIRLARSYTGRDKIIKFAGCYHGHADSLLVQAGSGVLTLGVPSSAGVPTDFTQHTLTATFNNLDSVAKIFEHFGGEIAAVIIEPIAGNMGCLPPTAGFLTGLRALCDDHGSVLIFDEVMTGFRVALGGAQALYGITPDLTTLGKIIGGGLPVGAFGGRRDIMEQLAPLGTVYQAGTLSGNPIATAAGYAALVQLQRAGFYQQLQETTETLIHGIQAAANAVNVPVYCTSVPGMFSVFFTEQPVTNFDQVMACDSARFSQFFHELLRLGVYLPPSPYESCFVSSSHNEEVITETLKAITTSLESVCNR